jgi:hypothetical protein
MSLLLLSQISLQFKAQKTQLRKVVLMQTHPPLLIPIDYLLLHRRNVPFETRSSLSVAIFLITRSRLRHSSLPSPLHLLQNANVDEVLALVEVEDISHLYYVINDLCNNLIVILQLSLYTLIRTLLSFGPHRANLFFMHQQHSPITPTSPFWTQGPTYQLLPQTLLLH